MEISRNIDLTGKSAKDQEKQEMFKKCIDPSENARQIASIGKMLEEDIFNAYETAKLDKGDVLNTPEGKELAAAVGPTVMLTQRDTFFVEQLADRYACNFGEPIYFLRSTDVPMGVVTASMTDSGPMSVNMLQTMNGYDIPVPVAGQRLVMTFEYDDPQLAESMWSSRSKAIDMARYRIRKSLQDMVLAAWQGAFVATFPACVNHTLAGGNVPPTGNIISNKVSDGFTGKLDMVAVSGFGNYIDTYGFSGQKIMFVSPRRFNDVKTWVSTSTITDAGMIYAKQIFASGASVDSIPLYDTLIVKKNVVPDNVAWCLCVDDGVSKTLGVYQWGKIQTVPSMAHKPLRAAFDVFVPGVAGVCHDMVRVAVVQFS